MKADVQVFLKLFVPFSLEKRCLTISNKLPYNVKQLAGILKKFIIVGLMALFWQS